jgi:hypothetical protein
MSTKAKTESDLIEGAGGMRSEPVGERSSRGCRDHSSYAC